MGKGSCGLARARSTDAGMEEAFYFVKNYTFSDLHTQRPKRQFHSNLARRAESQKMAIFPCSDMNPKRGRRGKKREEKKERKEKEKKRKRGRGKGGKRRY